MMNNLTVRKKENLNGIIGSLHFIPIINELLLILNQKKVQKNLETLSEPNFSRELQK